MVAGLGTGRDLEVRTVLGDQMTVDICMAYMLILVSMTMNLMQGNGGSANAKKVALNYLDN